MSSREIWLITGSQHLYGDETLAKVSSNAISMARALNKSKKIYIPIAHAKVVTTTAEITAVCQAANASENCIGVITWMHTFSPAKMWIRGLSLLKKPICHLHTQFNAGIPWDHIDMDFMNLNQSAHGDREFGHMMTRMRKSRKVVVGHWESSGVQKQLDDWARAALGWNELQHLNVARIGDNMREVAVTEGDKVAAQQRFGFAVNGYGISDVMAFVNSVSDEKLKQLLEEYDSSYQMCKTLQKNGEKRSALVEAARIEMGLRLFLEEVGCMAFTDTFENLGSFRQLPGIAVQRLMADGFGFGAEGDWKTAALLRSMKCMAKGLPGGTSFMEDYTYHFAGDPHLVLGAHMLEICPSIAASRPSCEIHPLAIGGKADPVRLVFDGREGNALNASLIDIGNRFRLLVNEVECTTPLHALPKLPVARALWDAKPSLEIAASAWILAGGAHHTAYTQALKTQHLEDLAEMAGIELLVIDKDTRLRDFKQSLRTNEVYYQLYHQY